MEHFVLLQVANRRAEALPQHNDVLFSVKFDLLYRLGEQLVLNPVLYHRAQRLLQILEVNGLIPLLKTVRLHQVRVAELSPKKIEIKSSL